MLSRAAELTVRLTLVLGGLCASAIATAQNTRRDVSPLNLPRPGYDYEGHNLGGILVLPQIELTSQYDSNLFATSQNEVDDVRFELVPSLKLKRDVENVKLRVDFYGQFRRHAENERENSDAFGAFASFERSARSGARIYVNGGYDRVIESRGDPESRAGPTDRPRRIDDFRAEFGFRQPIGRIFAEAIAGAEKFNYLDPAEDDRDLASYRGSLRLSYRTSPDLDLFVEGYVNRRDFRLAQDFSGVNRDSTTYGAYVGFQKELGQRLRGRLGVGVFRADPDSSALSGFTGVGANGELIWTPRVRTALSLRLSRGDVATVRGGATGRIDTTVRLGLNQEVRHNLLLSAYTAYSDAEYRGSARGHLKTFTAGGEVEYLANRRIALFVGANFADRNANAAVDRFQRTTVQAGIRLKL